MRARLRASGCTRLFIIPQSHFALAVLANMNNVQLGDLERALVLKMQLPYPAPQP